MNRHLQVVPDGDVSAAGDVVADFWAGKRPVNWPPALPFPTDMARAAEAYKHKRRLFVVKNRRTKPNETS